jgi:hypothetical protein
MNFGYGTLVGVDRAGNKYYEDKTGVPGKTRWVVFGNYETWNATDVPAVALSLRFPLSTLPSLSLSLPPSLSCSPSLPLFISLSLSFSLSLPLSPCFCR